MKKSITVAVAASLLLTGCEPYNNTADTTTAAVSETENDTTSDNTVAKQTETPATDATTVVTSDAVTSTQTVVSSAEKPYTKVLPKLNMNNYVSHTKEGALLYAGTNYNYKDKKYIPKQIKFQFFGKEPVFFKPNQNPEISFDVLTFHNEYNDNLFFIDDSELNESGKNIYCVTKDGKIEEIAKNITGAFEFSKDFSTLIYSQANEDKNEDKNENKHDIFIYKNGVKTKVVSTNSPPNLCCSPDGSAFSYSNGENNFLYVNGKTENLGNINIRYISNEGKYIFFSTKTGNGLQDYDTWTQKGSDISTRVKIGTNYDDSDLNGFIQSDNFDNSQLIWRSKNYSYVIKDGKPHKISGEYHNSIYPYGTKIIKDFANTYYYTYTKSYKQTDPDYGKIDIYYIDNNYESHLIANNADSFNEEAIIRENGLFYLKDNNIYKTTGDRTILMSASGSKEIVNIGVSRDGSYYYYINSDNEIYYKKGNDKEIKIADKITNIPDTSLYVVLTQKELNVPFNNCYYFIKDNCAYYVKDGGKPQKIQGIDGNVINIETTPFYVELYTGKKEQKSTLITSKYDKMYYSENGTNFSLFFDYKANETEKEKTSDIDF